MQRRVCPEIIRWQLANIQSVFEDIIRIHYTALDCHEGDDIINTVVRLALNQDFNSVHIIGDDKDLLSILSDNRVRLHRKSGSLSPSTVHVPHPESDPIPVEDYNVLPHQIPDFLALVGDRVDNIPV